jgi:hypothetical protein
VVRNIHRDAGARRAAQRFGKAAQRNVSARSATRCCINYVVGSPLMSVVRAFCLVQCPAIAVVVALAGVMSTSAFAATTPGALYKCPGEPVTYTTDAKAAQENACPRIDSPLIVLRSRAQRSRPARLHAAAQMSKAAVAAPRGPAPLQIETASVRTASFVPVARGVSSQYVIPAEVQQQRDHDRLGVLQDELTRERAKLARFKTRLAQLRAAGGDGKIDSSQVADVELAVARSEIDVVALSREVKLALR